MICLKAYHIFIIVKQYIATESDIAHVYTDVKRSQWHVIK